VVAPLACTLGVDQDIGDVLDVPHLMGTFAHLDQRVEAGGMGVGRIEQEAVGELGAPAGRQRSVLTLDVVDDGRARPRQQGGHHQTDALAGTRRRNGEHVLWAADIATLIEAEDDAATVV
jgi:hypothetical protein